jgi:hypothetical protein
MRELAIFSPIAFIDIFFAILRHYIEGGAPKVFNVHVYVQATRAFSQLDEPEISLRIIPVNVSASVSRIRVIPPYNVSKEHAILPPIIQFSTTYW